MKSVDVLTSRIADALAHEHCGLDGEAYVTSCDICFAFEHELYLWAAHLLTGETECPRTERAYIAFEKHLGTEETNRRLEAERLELLTYPHKRCPVCGSITRAEYEEDIDSCRMCSRPFPVEHEDEEELAL